MVDRDEEEENKTEASRDIRRREAELFGESFEEDELNDNTSANAERSNDDNNNTGDEDDTTKKTKESPLTTTRDFQVPKTFRRKYRDVH